MTKSFSHTPI